MLYSSRMIFNDKTTKILMIKKSMWQVLFHFSRSTSSIKSFNIKNLGQYKKLPWDEFLKKKKNSLQNIL